VVADDYPSVEATAMSTLYNVIGFVVFWLLALMLISEIYHDARRYLRRRAQRARDIDASWSDYRHRRDLAAQPARTVKRSRGRK
jgi:hypothetical protein